MLHTKPRCLTLETKQYFLSFGSSQSPSIPVNNIAEIENFIFFFFFLPLHNLLTVISGTGMSFMLRLFGDDFVCDNQDRSRAAERQVLELLLRTLILRPQGRDRELTGDFTDSSKWKTDTF